MKTIRKILSEFNDISLQEMDSVSLLNRIDSKYIFASGLLMEILEKAKENYRVLTIDNERMFSYRTLYYDTADDRMYKEHHNGKVNRYKIRFRSYENNNLSFLEVKYKTKNSRTIKKRIEVPSIDIKLEQELTDFIRENTPFETENLEPKIYTTFSRVTLVNKGLSERVTIDHSLKFEKKSFSKELSNLAIAEVKQDGSNGHTTGFINILDEYGISPRNMSKYCIGRILTDNNIKYNRFKENLLVINKISNEE